ncbi:hypothetical protein XENOCAPTIV_027979 [Xenoophorus captivus]|uniref:Uncharacterized protein n=1 Tax=Xenoophorus captivus TaxID=1517983 RepID=A0ABV0QTR9_9TELE
MHTLTTKFSEKPTPFSHFYRRSGRRWPRSLILAFTHTLRPPYGSTPDFVLSNLCFFSRLWIQKAILVLGGLYKWVVFKSFNDLKVQFRLPHSQFWKYLQL